MSGAGDDSGSAVGPGLEEGEKRQVPSWRFLLGYCAIVVVVFMRAVLS